MSRPKSEKGREIRLGILEFIAQFKKDNGYCPTQAQIQEHFGISKGSVQWHLRSLVEQKYIEYHPHDFARTLTWTRKNRENLE